MESTIRTCALRPAAAAMMSSTPVAAINLTAAASKPSRRARNATCFKDSSPVAYSTAPERLRAAAAWSISVDLPIPGSPPIRATEPGTRPPPRTRSSSVDPVGHRGTSTMASAATDEVRSPLLADLARSLRELAAKASPTRVFHSPQAAHCPCHFGEEAAQFWQINTSFGLAMRFLNVDL